MLDGKKMYAIFGFCDIRNFADITDVLKKDVMIFVNEVAEIVHNLVTLHQGAPNKNIGDAFLLVWKVPDSDTVIGSDGQIVSNGGFNTQVMADLALASFIQIIAKINKSKKLERYRQNKALAEKMGKPYKVNMGFGLHSGWAVEGAIGSKFKIDASYLSPNVNMSSRLEAATRQFGVSILVRYDLD